MNRTATDGGTASTRGAPRRIVLAMILLDEEVAESLAPKIQADRNPDADQGRWNDPASLASMPLLFMSQANWWGVAATIGTGASPARHGVLTWMAIDESTFAVRPRRASDADRPWVWDRLAAHGCGAVVVGWPGIADVNGSRVPIATTAAVLAARRLKSLAAGEVPEGLDPQRVASPETLLAQLVSPTAAAADVARAVIAIGSGHAGTGHQAASARSLEMTLSAAEALEAHSGDDPSRPRLWALGFSLREQETAAADRESPQARAERVSRVQKSLAATLTRLTEATGGDGVLIAAAVGDRSGRLWHSTVASSEDAAAVDLVPTVLELAGVPIAADLEGDSLISPHKEVEKSWDISAWSSADSPGEAIERRPSAGTLARKALAARGECGLVESLKDARPLEQLLVRHFETEWAISLRPSDWGGALSAAEALVTLCGREIDLWRVVFAAHLGQQRPAGDRAAGRLRSEHPESLSTKLMPLLVEAVPTRELVESFDLAELRTPSHRSVLGRAAARLRLDAIARKALTPLIAHDIAIAPDRIALANVLLRLGEGSLAVAALGWIGAGAASPGRVRVLRARCLAAAGLRDRAISLLDRYLLQTPFDGEARRLREHLASGA